MYMLEEEIMNRRIELEKEMFYKKISQLENTLKQNMTSKGYKYVKTASRTVVFSFGEICFNRRCYCKNGHYRYPLDEYLNLSKYERYSNCFLCELAELASCLPYRKVVQMIEKTKRIHITKDTVLKAVKLAGKLYHNLKDYDYYQESEKGKRTVNTLYIEGDGVVVKAKNIEQLRKDVSHILIHEGTKIEYGKRKKLKNKHEIIAENSHVAFEEALRYIDKTYHVNEKTTFITNSDMGTGYGKAAFEQIPKVYKANHEHFWDKYHILKEISNFTKFVPLQLINQLTNSIEQHDRQTMNLVFDTMESIIEDTNWSEKLLSFKRRINHNFKYTIPAYKRSVPIDTVGVMESQHCKIANRMKGRKMYWSVQGAITMAKMIVDCHKGDLRELFLGEWRKEYQEIEEKYYQKNYIKKNIRRNSSIPTVDFVNSNKRGKYLGRV